MSALQMFYCVLINQIIITKYDHKTLYYAQISRYMYVFGVSSAICSVHSLTELHLFP